MTIQTFPTSPPPTLDMRRPFWASKRHIFDSGARQGFSPRSRPTYQFALNMRNKPLSQINSLEAFINSLQADKGEFFFGDPYDQVVGSAQLFGPLTTATTVFLYDINSYAVYPASGGITIISAMSGSLIQNTDYQLDNDTGILNITSLPPNSADIWTVQSTWFFKKVGLVGGVSFQSPLWSQFNTTLRLEEIAHG